MVGNRKVVDRRTTTGEVAFVLQGKANTIQVGLSGSTGTATAAVDIFVSNDERCADSTTLASAAKHKVTGTAIALTGVGVGIDVELSSSGVEVGAWKYGIVKVNSISGTLAGISAWAGHEV